MECNAAAAAAAADTIDGLCGRPPLHVCDD